jgi:hypothetical protein
VLKSSGRKASDVEAPNVLPLSCAATDRLVLRLRDSGAQNSTDLGDAQRRRLQRRVGRERPEMAELKHAPPALPSDNQRRLVESR